MKKISRVLAMALIIFISMIFFLIILGGCSTPDIKTNAEVIAVESQYYSQEDIREAIEVVEKKFISFTGCTLTKIGYVGDDKIADYTNDMSSYIVLDCEFSTSESSISEGFEPNYIYDYGVWTWYLTKDVFGNWTIEDYGVA